MDKLKNIVSGHKQDDARAHGDVQSDEPISTSSNKITSGEGSHFGNARTTGNEPLSSSTNPTSTIQAPAQGRVSEPHPSRMPGTFDDDAGHTTSHHQPYKNKHDTTRSFPLGGHSMSSSGYSAPGQVGTYPAGGASLAGPNHGGASTTTGPHSSDLANKADPRVDSDLDGSHGVERNVEYGSYNAGPHSSTVANKVDPRVDTNTGASRTVDSKGTQSNASGLGSGILHGEKSRRHDHDAHGHIYKGDPCGERETSAPGLHFTSGPHATDTANRLDPNVSSEVSNALGSNTDNHHNRGAALAGGTHSVTGVGGTKASHGDPSSSHTKPSEVDTLATGPAPNTAGPHKSDLLNKADPRVDSDLSKQHDRHVTALEPSSTGTFDPKSSSVGLKGAASFNENSPAEVGHHYSRDAALAGAGGIGAYEANKHLGSHSTTPQNRLVDSSHQPTTTSSSVPQDRLAGSGHQSNVLTDTSIPYSSAGRDQGVGHTHHTQRDTTLGGASGGGLAAHKYNDKDNEKLTKTNHQPVTTTGTSDPYSTTNRHHHTSADHQTSKGDHTRDVALGAGVAGLGAHEYDRQDRKLTDSKHQRSTAIPPGTHETSNLGPATGSGLESSTTRASDAPLRTSYGEGAGATGLASHEYKDRDAKKFEQEQYKEAKHADREVGKHDKTATKVDPKHEHHESDQKKPGLVDRIFHRHQDDKETTAAETSSSHGLTNTSVSQPDRTRDGVLAGHSDAKGLGDRKDLGGTNDSRRGGHLVGNEYEHGSSSGVHDAPIGSGHTTHEAYHNTEGHNKLHKNPPAKVVEERGL